MIIAEIKKIKRHYLIPLSISVVIMFAILAMFQLVGAHDSVQGYLPLVDGILWNNVTLAFPFLITFFGGYIINREYTDDTMKNNIMIPISYQKLKLAKIVLAGIATVLFVGISFVCSILFAILLHYPFTLRDIGTALRNLFITGITCYISVIPLIALFSIKKNAFLVGTCGAFVYGFCGIFVADTKLASWYPITAGLTIIKYNPSSLNYHLLIAIFVLAICIFFSLFVITNIRGQLYD